MGTTNGNRAQLAKLRRAKRQAAKQRRPAPPPAPTTLAAAWQGWAAQVLEEEDAADQEEAGVTWHEGARAAATLIAAGYSPNAVLDEVSDYNVALMEARQPGFARLLSGEATAEEVAAIQARVASKAAAYGA